MDLQEYVQVIPLLIALSIGYVIKNYLPFVPNNIIPIVAFIIGAFIMVWVSDWQLTPLILLQGGISGLASTGMHNIFKNALEDLNKNKN